MRNKILLYLVGVAAAFLLLLWIRSAFFGNGGNFSGQNIQPISIIPGVGITPLVYESRDPQTGDLLYVIRAQSAKPTSPGHYQLVQPRMQFYTNNGQCVLVTSDAGNFAVDQPNGPFSSKIYPRSGELYGNVAITVGPIDSFQGDSRQRRPGQIQTLLSAPISFDYQEGLLTSPGAVRLRGDQLAFDGSDLTVEIDVTKKTLNYLQITHGQKLVIRNALTSSRQTGISPATAPTSTAPAAAPNQVHGANVAPPAIYQLKFGEQVTAALAERSINAYNLSVLFSVGMGGANSAGPAQNTQSQPSTSSTAPSPNPADSGSGLIDPQHDLVVTWTGSLLVQPYHSSVDHLLNSRDVIIKATGQPDQPVVMHDGATRTATADEVDYETANQTLKMISLGLQPVTLIDNALGTLNCRTVVYENFMHRISFFGPGHLQIQSKAASGGPWQGQWDKGLTLSFAPEKVPGAAATPDNPQGKLLLQNAVMTGDASLIGSGTYISGDVLFADISNYLAADKTVHQALSYFGATSNVSIRSWRPDDPNQQAAPDSIDCNHLQMITAPSVASNPNSPPIPSLLLADGKVIATFHERSAAVQNPAGAAGRLLAIYQLGSDHLSAELLAKNSPAPGNSNLQSGRYTVGQFRLWQNLRIQIQNIDQPITATAYQLAGDAVAGTAVLSGSDPNASWPEIQQGTNFITGQKIALNRTTESMQIDGPGEASMPSDVAADNNAKNKNNKTTVTLHWTDQMFYHGPQQMAEFDGNVTALMTGQKDPVLTCARLQALLYRPQQQNASLKLAKIIALSSPAQPLVVARDSSFDPAGHLLTRLYLQCIRLNYDAADQILNIPGHGELLLQDFRPAQPGAGQERGQTGFMWDQSLEYHDASGIISLAGGVHMVFQPVQPFNTNNAEFGGVLPASSGPDSKLAIMDCNQLSAKFSRQKTEPGTSLSLGLGGQTRLTQVQAQEGAIQLSGITIAADVLEFDAVNQQAIAYSLDGREASVSDVKGQYHGEYEKAVWDMTKGRSGLELINPRGAIEEQQ